jgi:hypothetical protein
LNTVALKACPVYAYPRCGQFVLYPYHTGWTVVMYLNQFYF